MNPYSVKGKKEFDSIREYIQKDLSSLRIGRATPALVENVQIESYGVMMPLKQVASITSPDAKTILIQPWDKNILKEIEKGIIASNIGLNPVNEGSIIRINLPPLTEEDRKKLVKILHQKIEQGKIKIRLARDKIREEILRNEKNKIITQDDKFNFLRELDEITKKENEELVALTKIKEEEIMKI